jgi:hypothetical protein
MTRQIILTAFAFLPLWISAQAIGVPCPTNPVVYGDFSGNSPLFWNNPYWWDDIVNQHDLAEGDVNLELNFTDSCALGSTHVRYILYLDLDNNGALETVVDSDSLPPSNTVYFGNKDTFLTAGAPRQFDFRLVNNDVKYGFGLKVDSVAPFTKSAAVRWKNVTTTNNTFLPQLPYGTHKIKWILSNTCDSTKNCTYDFTVIDYKKPTVVMVNQLSLNLVSSGTAQVLASDLLQYVEDNYTPSAQIMLGVRRAGSGTGFPFNPDGTPQDIIEFDCDDIGLNLVELWGRDVSGNSDFASGYILVKDNMAVCGDTIPCELKLYTGGPNGEPIEDVSISIGSFMPGMPSFPPSIFPSPYDPTCFTISYSNGSTPPPDVNIYPYNELDPLNGINTWDLILIKRHLSGQETLDNPYKLIAADINKSGTITVFDRLELRKLILGTYTKFPANSSWRFVDKNQIFPNPLNPFTEVFRHSLPYGQWSLEGKVLEFIGIKIGDVDNTATPNNLTSEVENRNNLTTVFNFKDQMLSPLETITLHFEASDAVEGYQMALNLAQFEVLDIVPQKNLTIQNFGQLDGDILTVATELPGQSFDVQLRAKQSGQLSNMLSLKDEMMHTMAFTSDGTPMDIALRFDPINSEAPLMYPVLPNPWNESTNLHFYLPEHGTATLAVVDGLGRTIYTHTKVYDKGHQSITLEDTQIPAAGLYWLVLETGSGKLVQKMVKYEH